MQHSQKERITFLILVITLIYSVCGGGSACPQIEAQRDLTSYKLRDFRVLPAEGEHRHPISKLYCIEGMGVESMDEATLIRFTQNVLASNPELAMDRSTVLSRPTVRFADTLAIVEYKQKVVLSDGSLLPVFFSSMRFFFRYDGCLTQIGNYTFQNLDNLKPGKLDEWAIERAAFRTISKVPVDVMKGDSSPNVPRGINDGAIATERVMMPFAAEEVRIDELGVYVKGDDPPCVAYQVLIKGRANGAKDSRIAFIDAQSGKLLSHVGTHLNAFTQKGTVETYDPNPTQKPNPLTVPVYSLDSKMQHLYGAYAEAHNSAYGDAVNPNFEFKYYSAPIPEDSHMIEAQVYYINGKMVRECSSIGFKGLFSSPQYIDACDTYASLDYYNVENKEIHIKGASVRPHGYDSDLFLHEYRHAMHHYVGGSGPCGYPFSASGGLDGNRAMDEGLADYSGTSFNNNRDFAEYIGEGFGWPYWMTLNSDYNVVDHTFGGNPTNWGISFGAGFWDLYERLGKVVANQISIQMVYYILPTDDFDAALESCIIQADYDLYGGIHEDILRRVFSIRKMYGTAGLYPWTSSFPMSASRPYTDNEDDTQSYTIPSVTTLNVTFDAYTRIYYANETYTDYLYIMDGSDVEIPGSPFVARELQNKTVQVPGDTVKIRLWSIPDNNRTSAGYRVINICEVDPSNQAPVAQLSPSISAGMEPLVVTFDTSPSYDPDGTIICRTLDVGDGSPPVQLDTNMDVVHVYDRDGVGPIQDTTIFTATLTVTDNKGDTDTTTVTITVEPWKPIYVPDDYTTIQQAISAALDHQMVYVAPGTYYENIDFQGKPITVESLAGPESTVIDGSQAGSVVTFQTGEGAASMLKGFTLYNGSGTLVSSDTYGGAIYCINGSSPTITHNLIHGNSVTHGGGGIYCNASSPVMVNNILYENSAGYEGGGFCVEDSFSLLIVNNTLYENTATTRGGGVSSLGSTPSITNTILWNNSAPADAEIYDDSATAVVTYCDVKGGWTGSGNIDADPVFINPLNHDFHLDTSSSCIDAGLDEADGLPNMDIDENPRVFDGNGDGTSAPDMGCDESMLLLVPIHHTTIQSAIDAAANRCIIRVSPGTYVENLDFKGKRIVVESTDGPKVTILDGNGSGSVVTFQDLECQATVLDGFTIRNGSGTLITDPSWQYLGGGIYCVLANPTIQNNIITGNSADYGAAIYCDRSPYSVISNNTIHLNSAISGGGIYLDESAPEMTGNTFTENSAVQYGGGLFARESGGILTDNEFTDNSAQWGGAITLGTNADLEISENTFTTNSATDSGGAILCQSTAMISGNTFSGNTSDYNGGAITCTTYCTALIQNNSFSGNTAFLFGGGMYVTNCTATILNSTFADNSADYGGGLYTTNSTLTITNDTIYGNEALTSGGGIYVGSSPYPVITNTIFWNNTAPAGAQIQGTSIVTYCNVQGGFTGTGNIDADPEFKDAGADDFHLTRFSPCIDAGDNQAPSIPSKDMEGDPRVFPGNGTGLILIGSPPPPSVVDMGADEYCLLKFKKYVPK